MPRDGLGGFILPIGNPVKAGTIISDSWANTTVADLASEIAASVPINGQSTMTGQLRAVSGSFNAPSYSFGSELNSGMYLRTGQQIAVSVDGTDTLRTTPTTTTVLNDLAVVGNLIVSGETTSINATTIEVADLNIVVAKNAANSTEANGAGLTINGADASMTYNTAGDKFVFNKRVDATSFYGSGAGLTSIPNAGLDNNSITVIAGTGLVGGGDISLGGSFTLGLATAAGVYSLAGSDGITVSSSTGDVVIGSTATSANTASAIIARDASGNFSAGVMTGTATTARYADLAEMYVPDKQYDAGTVLIFGGEYEVTTTIDIGDSRVAGAVSTEPAYLMNSGTNGVPIALRGRVPVKVIGPVRKGDLLVTSKTAGYAMSIGSDVGFGQAVFAKSLDDNLSVGKKVVEAVVL